MHKTLLPEKPVRILVIRAGQLGDTVCASSIIEPLRNQFGENCIIDWVAKAGVGKVFAEDSRVNKIYELKNRKIPLPLNPGKQKIVINSFASPYNYIINLELGNIFNDVMRLCRANNKIGMPYRYFAEPPETHAVENLKLIYESFLDTQSMKLAVPKLEGTPVEAIRTKFNLNGDYVVFVTTNSHANKKSRINHRAWPVEHWRKLIEQFASLPVSTVLIGSREDSRILKQLGELPANSLNLFGKTSFPELVGLTNGAKCMISTDTGPTHIAAAVNTPVIALIGPTNFKRTGPYKTVDNVIRIIKTGIECSPCYHTIRLENCTDNRCMTEINPHEVLSTYNEMISEIQTGNTCNV